MLTPFLYVSPVFASGGAAGGETSGGTEEGLDSCYKNLTERYVGSFTVWDNCGASWQEYSTDATWGGGWPNLPEYNEDAGTYNSIMAAKNACAPLGGKFYFLSLRKARYDSVNDEIEYSTNPQYYRYQRQVKTLTSVNDGGSGTIPYVAEGAPSFASVHENFNTAKTFAQNYVAAHPEERQNYESLLNAEWPEISWFCWNDDWSCPPDDPTCGVPTPTPPSTTGFYSTSTVEVPASAAGGNIPDTTANDGQTKTVYFSTDSSSVTVAFKHSLGYNSNGFSMNPGGKLVGNLKNDSTELTNGVSTTWTVGNAYSDGSTWYHDPTTNDTGTEVSRNSNITISLPYEGAQETRCSQIDYNNKNVTMNSEEHVIRPSHEAYCELPDGSKTVGGTEADCDGAYTPADRGSSHTDYSPSYSDSGRSKVCVVVYRREHPSGGATPPSGTATSNLMFAGESANITWNTNAPYHQTHYATSGEASIYQVPSWVSYSSNLGRSSALSFRDVQSGITNSYHETKSVQVPDQVGDKYCHTFHYRYALAYGVATGGGSPVMNPPYGDVNYDLDTVCRTIAKKPSVAIWNSSILTNGGLLTSKADRWDAATFGNLADSSAYSRHTYGSWSEYLTVAGKGITNFSSGSSLARGSDRMTLIDNSTLTIANNNGESQLGHSGIVSSTTFRTRLQTYLGANSSPLASDTITGISNVSGTQIIRRSGDLTITGNITTNTGTYANIYEIPQVIIFVDGNVRISQNVTQIDAWIIATGEIDTCLEFVDGYTTADTINSRGNACSNQLVFNGPVIANNLKLRRSYGSDPTVNHPGTFGTSSEKYSPAEVFNLRTDVYLWAYAQAGRYDSSYTESYSRELAPRY